VVRAPRREGCDVQSCKGAVRPFKGYGRHA
jgi:hypothetical protein